MSERYIKLFTLPSNLYITGAPVVISAGALHKDRKTNRVFAQVKVRNISSKTIKAAKVKLTAFDTAGNPLNEEKEHQYLDLSASRNGQFGQKVPIFFDDNTTRSFDAVISEIIFDDNSIWHPNRNENWINLPKQPTLASHFDDIRLAKQYKINANTNGEYLPMVEKEFWFCACGAINYDSEDICCNCGKDKTELFNALDKETLTRTCDERWAKEAEFEEALMFLEKRKSKKIKIIFLTVIAVILILIIALGTSDSKKKKSNDQTLSISLIASEGHFDTIDTFKLQ